MTSNVNFSDHLLSCIREGDNEEAKTILRDLNPAELIDTSGTTLLHIAAENGNIDIANYLIDRGCQVDARDNDGYTPLMRAVDRDYIETTTVMIKANASVFVDNNEGINPAKLALDGGKILSEEVWEAVLHRVKVECSNESSLTAKKLLEIGCLLSRATILEDTEITKLMLDSGRNVDERDTDFPHFTPLQQSISNSDLEIVKLLIDRGADVDAKVTLVGGPAGCVVVLSILTEPNYVDVNFEIFKMLAGRGATLVNGGFARLLLRYLMRHGTKLIVNYLMSLDLGQRDQNFDLLLFLADNRNFDPVGEIQSLKLTINARTMVGERAAALNCAVRAGNAKTVEFFLSKGVDPNIVSDILYPALFYAFGSPDITTNTWRCVMTLLQHGTNVQCTCACSGIAKFTVFHYFRTMNSKNYEAMKLVFGRLAVMEASGGKIEDFVLTKIDADALFKKYFEACKRKVDMMKRSVVHGSVSQFGFLTARKDEIVKFARNRSMIARLRLMVNHKRRQRRPKFYCHVVLRMRAMRVFEIADLRQSVVDALTEIRGLHGNAYVIGLIADYYIHEELKNVELAWKRLKLSW